MRPIIGYRVEWGGEDVGVVDLVAVVIYEGGAGEGGGEVGRGADADHFAV